MSHFVGLVFGYNYNELLEPYDENREVDVYIKYTKDDAINRVRQERIDTYEYALRVLERFPNPSTEHEQSNVDWAKKVIDEGIDISYEEAWKIAKEWGYEIDDEGNLLSTYNPDSKWDWYVEGGRWGAWLLLKEKDENGNQFKYFIFKIEDLADAMGENIEAFFEIADMYNQYRANHKGKAPSKYWIINRDEVPEIKSFEEFKKKITE